MEERRIDARRAEAPQVERRSLRRLELSMLLESMPEAVFIFDHEGRLLEANRAAERIFGNELGRLTGNAAEQPGIPGLHGRKLEDLLARARVHSGPRELGLNELAITRALGGEDVPHESRVLELGQDRRLEASVAAHPIRDSKGEVLGALLVLRDESELHTLQRSIEDTATHKAMGYMAADLAHDFNNVLSTISQAASVLELLPATAPKEDRKLYVGLLHNAVQRGKEIVERMKEYIRGAGGAEGEVGMSQVLVEALELARPRIYAQHNIRLQTDLCGAPPIWGNASDLRRVFVNLILNALEAMPQGGVLVVKCFEQSGKVMGEVQDSGVGIPPEAQKKLFSPYFTTKSKGTGLGLLSSRQIIERHQGKLTFSSRPGETVFRVELPAAGEREKPQVA